MTDIEVLKQRAELVRTAIPQRPVIPQLGYVRLSEGNLLAHDSELLLSVALPIEQLEELEVSIDTANFDLFKKANEQAEVTTDEENLIITHNKTKLTIPFYDKDQTSHLDVNFLSDDKEHLATFTNSEFGAFNKIAKGCRVQKNKELENVLAFDVDKRILIATDRRVLNTISLDTLAKPQNVVYLPWRLTQYLPKLADVENKVELYMDDSHVYIEGIHTYAVIPRPKAGLDLVSFFDRTKAFELETCETPQDFVDFVDQAASAEKDDSLLIIESVGREIRVRTEGTKADFSGAFEINTRLPNVELETSAKRIKELMKFTDQFSMSFINNDQPVMVFTDNQSVLHVTI